MFIYISKETKKLKEFTHQDLNLPEEFIEPEGIPEKFIVFQSYYALFYYIPCWADEKIYAFRKDGHTYRAPESIKDHIEFDYRVKTPWYYYSGAIVGIGLAGFLLIQLIIALIKHAS